MAGSIYILPRDRVHPVDIPLTKAIGVFSKWRHRRGRVRASDEIEKRFTDRADAALKLARSCHGAAAGAVVSYAPLKRKFRPFLPDMPVLFGKTNLDSRTGQHAVAACPCLGASRVIARAAWPEGEETCELDVSISSIPRRAPPSPAHSILAGRSIRRWQACWRWR